MPPQEAGYTYAVVPCLPKQLACSRGGVHIRPYAVVGAAPDIIGIEVPHRYPTFPVNAGEESVYWRFESPDDGRKNLFLKNSGISGGPARIDAGNTFCQVGRGIK
jgi:hypothetical protein